MRLISILVVVLAALAAVAHAYGLQPGGQCVSQIYNLTYQGLPPGWYVYRWLDLTGTGTVHLVIRADVSSNVPVELAIYNAQWQRIWATQPSTRITGTYAVDLEAPGTYRLAVENPGANTASASFTAFINVTMCGGPAPGSWLGRFIKPMTTNVVLNGGNASMAPMGIASYGVMEVDGRYFAYTLTTDAVKGVAHIPSDVSAFNYWEDGSYYGQAFSVQLNAFVVARLIDGAVQYYSIQNVVGFDENHKGLEVGNNIWNLTTAPSILDKSAVRGKGVVCIYTGPAGHENYYVYGMRGSIPFGRVELETWARADDGKIIVEFYANGRRYDEVAITPYAPATSARIVIAPTTTPTGIPLGLGLVFAGHDGDIPWAVLHAGQIRLELYVRMNGSWVPPPSAWSVGHGTYEFSYASVVPQGVGSAIVKPGPPNPRQLWAGTVVVTPFGINITMSTDLSPYAESLPELVDLGNGTRLVLTEAYVDGRPAQTLSNVPLGSIVVLQYKRQYFVSISAPGNYTAGWFDEGSTIVIDGPPVVDFGNGTRLVNPLVNGTKPPLVVVVDKPLVVGYARQYLVTYSGPTWLNRTWINANTSMVFSPPQTINLGNGTRLAYPLVNGTVPPLIIAVNRPLVVSVSYTRQYLVSLTSPVNRTAVWANASSPVVLNLPPVVDFDNGTRLVEPRINGTRPPLVVEVNRPMSFVGTYVSKQYLVTYSGPIWLNRTWIDAGTSIAFNPPQIINFGNNTRLIDPLINGTAPPLSISVDKPIGLSVEYARQYLVSVNTPFNDTSVWINAGASYAPPASAISRNGVTFVPTHLTIDGRRAPLAPVAVNAPLNITVHYNAYAEVSTTFLGLPALYAEASITCGGASNSTSGLLAYSLRLELIDAPAGKCSISAYELPPPELVVVAVIAAIVVLFRKRKRS